MKCWGGERGEGTPVKIRAEGGGGGGEESKGMKGSRFRRKRKGGRECGRS